MGKVLIFDPSLRTSPFSGTGNRFTILATDPPPVGRTWMTPVRVSNQRTPYTKLSAKNTYGGEDDLFVTERACKRPTRVTTLFVRCNKAVGSFPSRSFLCISENRTRGNAEQTRSPCDGKYVFAREVFISARSLRAIAIYTAE